MKFLAFIILLSLISCYVEKRIQVKAILLRVKSADPAPRTDRPNYMHIIWVDAQGVEYDQYCDCPQYKPGYGESFLITR